MRPWMLALGMLAATTVGPFAPPLPTAQAAGDFAYGAIVDTTHPRSMRMAGVAAALGELTGYWVGVNGRELIARGKWLDKAEYWLRTYGFWCITFFSFIPNPFFDAIGFAAGVLRYSILRFALACFVGKFLKFLMAAIGGDLANVLGWLG